LRVQADGIDEARRAQAVQARRRLRVGFQAALLAGIALLMFMLVFPTLRLYMAQQVQKEQLRAQVQAAAAENEELTAALKRWEDPAYVKAQARERLSFAMPGERTYRVSDPENAPTPSAAPPTQAPPTHLEKPDQDPQEEPWYAKLWESSVVAGTVGAG
jgi:cell division protein FtsB